MSSAAGDLPAGWSWRLPGSPAYPVLLGTIRDPPALAVRGHLDPHAFMVAIVGARLLSPYGEELAYEIARGVAAAGVTVVSGMARGIDAAAHRGALDAGGQTIAVMGTGPDAVYPPEHRGLADVIAARGALVTQFPADTPPRKGNFPARNATISGLALGVVVVEARRQSGAMLTASAAGDQGRVVMAVPGSVHNPASRGCHDLIRDKAVLVTSAREVLETVESDTMTALLTPAETGSPGALPRPTFGDARDLVLAVLERGALTLDEVVAGAGAGAPELVSAVARLRLDGLIRLRDGVYGLAGAAATRE